MVTSRSSKAALSKCFLCALKQLKLTCYRLPGLPAAAAPADGEPSAIPSDTPTIPAAHPAATPTPDTTTDPAVDPTAPVSDTPVPVVDTPAPVIDTTAQTPPVKAAPVTADPVVPAE